MKLFTPVYFEDLDCLSLLQNLSPIDDHLALDPHFLSLLYQKKLKEEMEKSRIDYDKTPQFLYPSSQIDSFYTPHKFPKYDLHSQRIIGYMSKEEAYQFLKANEQNKINAFENRPPFDEEKFRKDFLHQYQNRMRHADLYIPKKYLPLLNLRLYGLGYLSSSLYERISADIISAEKRLDEMRTKEADYQATCNTYETDLQTLFFHQSNYQLISLLKEERRLRMILRYHGIRSSQSTGVEEIFFHDVQILEKDEDIPLPLTDSELSFLIKAKEIYKIQDGYEAHFLLERNHHLLSFIFTFQTMELEENFIRIVPEEKQTNEKP